jgi:GNAT superfamily N-acetyltransferase
MNGSAPLDKARAAVESAAVQSAAADSGPASWHVRVARGDDLGEIVAGVEELLLELGGTPAPSEAIEEAARSLLEDRAAGVLLVAQAREAIVGLLGASCQSAMHVPGRYALIQELWVHQSWRGKAIGADLLVALFELARDRGVARIEVGLPREAFAGIRATESFYLANGFAPLGERMQRFIA